MAAKPSPKPRMPRATSSSLMSDRRGGCGDVPSTRNLLETPSVAQSLDGFLRLKGSLRFPSVEFRSAHCPRARRNASYSEVAEIVSQAETWPLLKPLENQRLRCS